MKFIMVGILSFLTATSALACSCAMMTADQLMQSSDVVFIGVLAGNSVLTGTVDSEFPTEMENKTPFYVTKAYKNATARKTMDVYSTKGNGANCGVDFQNDNGVYVISAFEDSNSGKLITSSCNLGYLGNDYILDLVKDLNKLTNTK